MWLHVHIYLIQLLEWFFDLSKVVSFYALVSQINERAIKGLPGRQSYSLLSSGDTWNLEPKLLSFLMRGRDGMVWKGALDWNRHLKAWYSEASAPGTQGSRGDFVVDGSPVSSGGLSCCTK